MARKKSLVIEILGNNKMGRAVRDAMGSLRKLGKFAANVGGVIKKAFKFALVGVTAFTAGLGYALKESAKFNVQMARAWTMAGGGIGVFKGLREEVMMLSSELGVARDELASGLYQALSAGVPQDNVISFLRTAAKVAVADGSEVTVAIDGITTVLNAFGMEADETQAVVDKMFQTVKSGKTTFADLAANLSKAAPVASALGVSIDQVLAAVATMTKQGTPTEVALTSIRNSMLVLNKELGDGWAEGMTFQEALEKIGDSAGYSATKLEAMFGKRDIAQVMQMIGSKASGAASDLSNMTDSTGSLAVAFQKVQQFRFWERLGMTLKVIATRFGIAVEEGADLGDTIDKIAQAADKMGKDLSAKMLPYVKEIKEAFDNMLSGDPAKVKEGQDSLKRMFDSVGDYVGPKFEQWGEAAGAAIWRGFKKGGMKGLEVIDESGRKSKGGILKDVHTIVSTIGAIKGGGIKGGLENLRDIRERSGDSSIIDQLGGMLKLPFDMDNLISQSAKSRTPTQEMMLNGSSVAIAAPGSSRITAGAAAGEYQRNQPGGTYMDTVMAEWKGFKSSLALGKQEEMDRKMQNHQYVDRFTGGLSAAGSSLKETHGLSPGSSRQNPQYVQEVKPISGVEAQ